MKEAKVFLLDLNAPAGSAGSVKGILESSADPRMRVVERFVDLRGSSSGVSDVFDTVHKFHPDLIFLVLSSDFLGQAGAFIQSFTAEQVRAPIIAVIDGKKPDEMIEILKLGVVDFITPPFKPFDVLPRVWRLLQQQSRGATLTSALREEMGLKQLVGESPLFFAELKKIPLVSKCDSSVLISGETGTGKELFARAIHYLSPRSEKPFIPVNCGAIPAELVENELFGHVKGAFTGADVSQQGLIREAEGGTLFLDEIDCLPLSSQVKLLRFIQEKEYRQIGSAKTQKADIRIIAATNIELEKAVAEGKFRKDLFYRLNIIPFALPPLRARKGDIAVLARHFLERYAAEFDKQVADFTVQALQKIIMYDWPGNVRELEHIMERAVIFSENAFIEDIDIMLPCNEVQVLAEPFQAAKARVIADFEKNYIHGLLLAHRGNITRAAKAAEKNRRAFWELIRKHNIDVRHFLSDLN